RAEGFAADARAAVRPEERRGHGLPTRLAADGVAGVDHFARAAFAAVVRFDSHVRCSPAGTDLVASAGADGPTSRSHALTAADRDRTAGCRAAGPTGCSATGDP